MKKTKKQLYIGISLLLAFVLWTVLVRCVDVRAIGPRGSAVGFAALNGAVHRFFGVHMTLYVITDFAGLVPVAFMLGFAILGLCQWIGRRSFFAVDRSLLCLGGFYIAVLFSYLFFEECVINYRPVLINGYLEASYPSSTTLLVLSVMPTAAIQLSSRIKNTAKRRCVFWLLMAFTAFTVIGRLISGVHWVTDIVGGALLSSALVFLYSAVISRT